MTIDWPAKSPDLNPIEGIWEMMKSRIDVDLHADVADLEDSITWAWQDIPQPKINEMVLGLPDRVQKLQKPKGGNCQVKQCYL